MVFVCLLISFIFSYLNMIGCFAGEQILNGSTQFCLTTQSLSLLNHAFRRYSETKYDFEAKREGERSRHGPGRGRSQAKMTQEQEQFHRWRTNAQFLNDFITKTASLKVQHKSNHVYLFLIMYNFIYL